MKIQKTLFFISRRGGSWYSSPSISCYSGVNKSQRSHFADNGGFRILVKKQEEEK